jgi:two-component system NtrC family sensor kinase
MNAEPPSPASDPDEGTPRTETEEELVEKTLKRIIPERHITPEFVQDLLQTHRDGGDVQAVLLERAGKLLRQMDRSLYSCEHSSRVLREEKSVLQRIAGDLKSSFHELSVVDELVYAERGHRSMGDVLESFMGILSRMLPLAAIRLFLIDPATRAFVPVAERHLRPAQEQETEVRLEEGTFAWAIREGGPVVMPISLPSSQGRTLVIAPMALADQPLGVACLFCRLDDAEYTPQHFQLLRSVVGRASLSVENARRVQALETESSRVAAMKDYLGSIVDNMSQGILVVDRADAVTVFNRTAEMVFGVPREEAVGRYFEEALPDQLTTLLRDLLPRARRGEPVVDYEFAYDRGEGVSFRLGVTSTLLGERGRGGAVFSFRDLFTARELMRLRQSDRFKTHALDRFRENLEEAEKRLQRSEKLASIGQMAAGVAHEINNPLGSIAGFIQILLMDIESDAPDRSYLEAMQREVGRMKSIVEDLLSFSRQQPQESETFLPLDVNLLVEETMRLVEPQAHMSRAEVRTEYEEGLPRVMGLADRLKQALMNIALNAFFAMDKDDARLEVRTRSTTEDGSEWIEIAFIDNGEGIRQEDLNRIFDPFYTTREQGQGTGLGLSTCFGIVQQHGGDISVQSVWGEGSTFTVRLPVAGAEAIAASEGEAT